MNISTESIEQSEVLVRIWSVEDQGSLSRESRLKEKDESTWKEKLKTMFS
jgi:hypothetical protein